MWVPGMRDLCREPLSACWDFGLLLGLKLAEALSRLSALKIPVADKRLVKAKLLSNMG